MLLERVVPSGLSNYTIWISADRWQHRVFRNGMHRNIWLGHYQEEGQNPEPQCEHCLVLNMALLGQMTCKHASESEPMELQIVEV